MAVMATGTWSEADRSGIDFQVEVQVPWDAPEAFVTLDSLCVWWSRHHTIWHRLSPSCYLPYLLCRYLPTWSGRTVLL